MTTSEWKEWRERVFIDLVWTLTDLHIHVQNGLQLIWKYIEVARSEGNTGLAEQFSLLVLEDPILSHEFSLTELNWLSFKSYNISLQVPKSSCPELVIRLIEISLELIVEAREEGEHGAKVPERFRIHIQGQIQASGKSDSHNEWCHKYRVVLSLDFESAIFLDQWERATRIIEESGSVLDGELASTFLDCIIRSGAVVRNIAQAIQKVIFAILTSQSTSLDCPAIQALLPRYLHTCFQLCLDASEYTLAEMNIDQALSLASHEQQEGIHYPSDELQWMATVAFNQAIDFYLASNDKDFRGWAEKAIRLTDFGEPECCALRKLLQEKIKTLS
ncbi:hypothetical protein BDV25DRAFT_169373 [Aspergillus avenaceus]|uniref:Meiosis protein SPO22/ZIP4 like-domain-containing protein n=1 Tax=Aspergillus avenaceus TaxID=36643 RepID=A0A5N6TLB1_ASPAV|nr:hypothetical protein BDV25DRAFT_169373 [Aspergillus avenaceus]